MLGLMVSTITFAQPPQQCEIEVERYQLPVKFQHRSAEVQALQYQAFNVARFRLDEILKQPHAKKLAIVTDLDETIIDNTAIFVEDLKKCENYTSWKSWEAWEQFGQPELIPGSLAFLNYADQQGVTIFYISDRSQTHRQATTARLKQLNLPQVNDDQILLYGTSKEERRQHIQAQDYEIVLLLGDTLHDFSRAFSNQQSKQQRALAVEENKDAFGHSFIMLPNVSYGAWSEPD